MKNFVFVLLLVLASFGVNAQKKVVVVGSSTAFGTGASTYDSAWAGKLQLYYRQNVTDGLDTVVTNLALGGYTTYQVMPTGYTPPAGRPAPDPARNVTMALSLSPDIIIFNLPSNDIASAFSKEEVMSNFRTLYQTVISAPGNVKAFITTTQPRDLSNVTARQYQRDLVDSISNVFGPYSINFWNDLATTDGTNMIKPEVSAGDGTHVNNLGHRLLFQQVVAADIFNVNVVLPVKLIFFKAQLQNRKVLISWRTEDEEPNTLYEIEQGSNGIDFSLIHRLPAIASGDYSWTVDQPAPGKNYYRLKLIEPGKISYSVIELVQLPLSSLSIRKLSSSASMLHLQLFSNSSQALDITVHNSSGARMLHKSLPAAAGLQDISLPVSTLSRGVYFIQVLSPDGSKEVRQFVRN